MAEKLTLISVRGGTDDRARLMFADLDGIRIGLRFRWSAYSERWMLWLHAVDGSTISGPRMLVPGLDLLEGDKHDPRVPPGQLFVYSPDREPPTLSTVDVDALLYYRNA